MSCGVISGQALFPGRPGQLGRTQCLEKKVFQVLGTSSRPCQACWLSRPNLSGGFFSAVVAGLSSCALS